MAEYGYCQCGCGLKTTIAATSSKRDNKVKGEPMRFMVGHGMRGKCIGIRKPNAFELRGDYAVVFLNGKGRAECKVDVADREALLNRAWAVSSDGYAVNTYTRHNKRHTIKMSRLILGMADDDERQCDHMNRDRLDNRRANLRIATPSENSYNRQYPSSTGLLGVSVEKRCPGSVKIYKAHVQYNGKKLNLGRFCTPQEAHEVAMQFRREHNLLPTVA